MALDGTAANANKVNYTTLTGNTSILERALNLSIGTYEFSINGASYTGGDLPNSNYSYGRATVQKRADNAITVILWGFNVSSALVPAINQYGSNGWSGWKTLSLKEDLETKATLGNDARFTGVQLGINGKNYIYDDNGNLWFKFNGRDDQAKWLAMVELYDAYNKVNSIDGNYLPLSGGTLSGNIFIQNNEAYENAQVNVQSNARKICLAADAAEHNGVAGIYDYSDGEWIIYSSLDNYVCIPHTLYGERGHKVIHEGDKPTGSYTGNNSATSRTITVGGLGQMLLISSDTGMALVSGRGAICMDRQTGAVSGLKSWEINYNNGVLTIATNSALVNSSQSYWYQVL